MVDQLKPQVGVLGFLITMSRKEARSVAVMMDLDQNLFPSTASFGASFCCRDQWLSSSSQGRRGRGIHDSHVGRSCNDWMAPQWAYILNRKLQLDSKWVMFWGYILFNTSWKEATPPGWHSYGRYGQVQVGRHSS